VNVLACGASELVVAASAAGLFGGQVYGVFLITVRGGDEPKPAFLGEFRLVGYLKTALRSGVHRVKSSLGVHTAEAYNSSCSGYTASAVWFGTPVVV
jgi:hypothetical protein